MGARLRAMRRLPSSGPQLVPEHRARRRDNRRGAGAYGGGLPRDAPDLRSGLMPKEVDHDQRREELLEAVWRVIARDGMEGATIRAIAKETGWSTGVLAHYFGDKDDIISSALRLAYERIAARWDAKLEGLTGIRALHELVLDNLPLDEERELETRLLMNYWSRVIRGQDGTPPPSRRGPLLIDLLAQLVADGQEAGEVRSDEAPEDIAER